MKPKTFFILLSFSAILLVIIVLAQYFSDKKKIQRYTNAGTCAIGPSITSSRWRGLTHRRRLFGKVVTDADTLDMTRLSKVLTYLLLV